MYRNIMLYTLNISSFVNYSSIKLKKGGGRQITWGREGTNLCGLSQLSGECELRQVGSTIRWLEFKVLQATSCHGKSEPHPCTSYGMAEGEAGIWREGWSSCEVGAQRRAFRPQRKGKEQLPQHFPAVRASCTSYNSAPGRVPVVSSTNPSLLSSMREFLFLTTACPPTATECPTEHRCCQIQ